MSILYKLDLRILKYRRKLKKQNRKRRDWIVLLLKVEVVATLHPQSLMALLQDQEEEEDHRA